MRDPAGLLASEAEGQVAVDTILPQILAAGGVTAVLWWRMAQVEKEVLRLRDSRHELHTSVARVEGAVATLTDIVSRALNPNREASP
jgi:hypothetical protein